jgi:hypothetical protein
MAAAAGHVNARVAFVRLGSVRTDLSSVALSGWGLDDGKAACRRLPGAMPNAKVLLIRFRMSMLRTTTGCAAHAG